MLTDRPNARPPKRHPQAYGRSPPRREIPHLQISRTLVSPQSAPAKDSRLKGQPVSIRSSSSRPSLRTRASSTAIAVAITHPPFLTQRRKGNHPRTPRPGAAETQRGCRRIFLRGGLLCFFGGRRVALRLCVFAGRMGGRALRTLRFKTVRCVSLVSWW